MISRRGFLAGAAASAAALAGCSAPTEPRSTSADPARGSSSGAPAGSKRLADSVVLGAVVIADTLDPHGTLSYSQFMTARQVFDALVTYDDKGDRIVPQLATEWQRIDPLTVELRLRDDVKFSNGEDFTADTVAFNVRRVLDAKDPLYLLTQQRMGPLAGAEAMTSTTVRIHTSEPDPLLLNRLSMLFMVPPRYTADGGDLKMQPIGTGSFRVVDYQAGSQVSYEAWDGGWRGKSTVQRARIQRFGDVAGLVSALRTGEVDIAWNFQGDQAARLRDNFQVTGLQVRSCFVCSLFSVVPAFGDRRVRQAVNYAVNKEELIRTINGGFGIPAPGQLLTAGMPGFDDTLQAFPYDPDRARSLLREAGFPSFEASVGLQATGKGMAEAIAGYLRAVGINLAVNVLETPVFLVNLGQRTSHPLLLWAPDYFHLNDFDAAAARFADTPPRQSHFDNAEFRQLYNAARTELDPDRRAATIKRAAGLMYEEAACLFLAYRDTPLVYSKRLAPLAKNYDASVHLWQVEKEA